MGAARKSKSLQNLRPHELTSRIDRPLGFIFGGKELGARLSNRVEKAAGKVGSRFFVRCGLLTGGCMAREDAAAGVGRCGALLAGCCLVRSGLGGCCRFLPATRPRPADSGAEMRFGKRLGGIIREAQSHESGGQTAKRNATLQDGLDLIECPEDASLKRYHSRISAQHFRQVRDGLSEGEQVRHQSNVAFPPGKSIKMFIT